MDRQVITTCAEPPVQTSGERGRDQNLSSEEDRLDWLENQPSPQSSSREAYRQQLFA